MTDGKREAIISQLLETMSIAKRSMFARMQTISQDCPISGTQLELLSSIAHLQPISFKQLAAQMQLSPGAVSQLADGLEQQSLIVREVQAEDRRVQFLRVSEAGHALLKRVIKPRQEVMEQLMQHLTDEELTVWLHIQQKMIAEFQNLTPPKSTSKGDK